MFEGQFNSQINVLDFVILESRDFFLYFFVIFNDFPCEFSVIFQQFVTSVLFACDCSVIFDVTFL